MAYDANDPADKKIVSDAVAAALAEQAELHEADIQGLKDKNKDLTERLRKARTEAGGDNTAEITRLENELSESQSQLRAREGELRTVNRDLKAATETLATTQTELETERTTSRNEFVKNRLTAELTGVNVQPDFLDDLVKARSGEVVVKEVNGERSAFVGDKPLGEFVKEWSESDKGKRYLNAPGNTGGSAAGSGNASGGAKKIYEMTELERTAAYNANPADFNARVAAGENLAPAKA